MEMPTVEELESFFREGKMKRLGDGSRRVCYALPGGKLCIKSYRSEAELETRMKPDGSIEKHTLRASVIREIRKARFDEKSNTSCQEYRYWKRLREKLPPEVFGVFPQTMTCVLLPSRGWCIVEELVQNADGSSIKKLVPEYRSAGPSARSLLVDALRKLKSLLVSHAVRFYDPQNIMVQFASDGAFCLRIVDFEPASRTLIQLDRLFPCMKKMKTCRRLSRFERRLEKI